MNCITWSPIKFSLFCFFISCWNREDIRWMEIDLPAKLFCQLIFRLMNAFKFWNSKVSQVSTLSVQAPQQTSVGKKHKTKKKCISNVYTLELITWPNFSNLPRAVAAGAVLLSPLAARNAERKTVFPQCIQSTSLVCKTSDLITRFVLLKSVHLVDPVSDLNLV